nr:DUF1819 family protein [Methanobrevibacter smithii]
MKYSAGLVSTSFWFIESKKIAEFILEGYSKKEIMEMAIEENIFQVETNNRVKEIVNGVYRRLNSFPEEILECFIRIDVNSAKIFVLISILNNDKLFFEFMHEVFKEHILLGDMALKDRDFDIFFDNKSYQSDIVEKWTDETVARLKRGYRNMLSEAGVLDTSNKEKVIIVPFVDLKLQQLLIDNNFGPYLFTITGEK